MIARSRKSQKRLTIAMAGGGTGGHVFPIKSLIEWIQKKPQYIAEIEHIYRFGTIDSLESKVCSSFSQSIPPIDFVPILSGKLRRETIRQSRLKNIRDIFLFAAGFFQSLVLLLRYRIDVIFCKGGYVALPAVLAAALLQKKIIVHESDTHTGLVNKMAARFASKVFTGFDNVLPDSKTVGQILSDEILVEDLPAREHDKPKVLIVGGSQGSRRLYQSIIQIFQKNPEILSSFDFFFVLGLLNQDMSTQLDKYPSVRTYNFLSQKEMGELFASCDIAITRGGTTSLAEHNLYDLKQIIVPIPWTHDQYDNAKRYVQHNKDIMIDQRDVGFHTKLVKALTKLKTFKKKERDIDRQAVVSRAKEIIIKSILN